MEEKYNKDSMIAFVLLMLAIVVFLFYPDEKTIMYGSIGVAVLSLVAVIFGYKAKKELQETPQKGKSFASAAIVVGIILFVFCILGIISLKMMDNPEFTKQICPQATDCVDNNDGTKTCKFSGVDIKCAVEEEKESEEETPTEQTKE